MYKIYINETPLVLIQSDKMEKISPRLSNELVVAYPGKSKFLLNYIDMLEKTFRFDRVVIHHINYKQLKEDFLSLFNSISAYGGIVFNNSGQLLVIYRRGYWDLPKGKINAGEKKKAAAKREVMEETGLKNVTLVKKVGTTHHTFKTHDKARNLKKTVWYHMTSSDTDLIPQLEEDIEIAEWIDIHEFLNSGRKMYKNISDILLKFLDKKAELSPSKINTNPG